MADIHDIKSEQSEMRRDVISGNRLTIANLVLVALALFGIVATLLGKHP